MRDDNDKVLVLNEGGNITSPTTLRPVFSTRGYPAGRYAAKHENGTVTQAKQTALSSVPTKSANSTNRLNNASAAIAPRPQRTKSNRERQRTKKRPPTTRKKKKRPSQIPSQLLGFKYPADRKRPKGKGKKNNSPLAKAKRKRKMKEREKKRNKLSKQRAEREKNRIRTTARTHKDQSGTTSTRTTSKPVNEDMVSKKNMLDKLIDGSKHNSPLLDNIHRYQVHEKATDPAFFSQKLMETIRKSPGYRQFLDKNIPSKSPEDEDFSNLRAWTPPPNYINNAPSHQLTMTEPWGKHWDSAGDYHVSPLLDKEKLTFSNPSSASRQPGNVMGTVVETSERKHLKTVNLDVVHSSKENGNQNNMQQPTSLPTSTVNPSTKLSSVGKETKWHGPHYDMTKYNPNDFWNSKPPSFFFTGDQKQEPTPASNLFENANPIRRRIDLRNSNLDEGNGENPMLGDIHRLFRVHKRSTKPPYPTENEKLNGTNGYANVRRFPQTEASLQLQSRILATLQPGTHKGMPSIIKHVPPVISVTNKRDPDGEYNHGKIKLMLDIAKWRAQTHSTNITNGTGLLPMQLTRQTGLLGAAHTNTTKHQMKDSNDFTENGMNANVPGNVTSNKNIHHLNASGTHTAGSNITASKQEDQDLIASQDDSISIPSEHHESLATTPENNDNETSDDNKEDDNDETTELPEHDESDPSWEHNDPKIQATHPTVKYVLPSPPVNKRKYPFYRAPESEKLTSYTPLRYASNPYDVPIKTEGGMEFYESRDRAVHCEGPRKPENVVPERGEDGEWNKKPQPEGPRLGTLGDVIGCMRKKLFGQDPLDNPFFQETSVGLPQETAMVGLLMDATGTPEPKTVDQFGFYRDILENIRMASVGPNPEEVKNRPYIRVGAEAFDSGEAPSSPANVRVAYAVPRDAVGAPHPSRKHVPTPTADRNVFRRPVVEHVPEDDKGPTRIKLKQMLQESYEDSSEHESGSAKTQSKLPEQDSSQSSSVEYYVDTQGRPVSYTTGSKLEKSEESKQGKKRLVYHNIVRPASNESLELNSHADESDELRTNLKAHMETPERGTQIRNTHRDRLRPKKPVGNQRNDTRLKFVPDTERTYIDANNKSKAMTEAQNEYARKGLKNVVESMSTPPISKTVLKSLESTEILPEPSLRASQQRKNNTGRPDPSGGITNQFKLANGGFDASHITQKLKSVEDLYELESSESSDFVRPKGNKTGNGPLFFSNTKKKGDNNEFHEVKSFSFSLPEDEGEYEGEEEDDDDDDYTHVEQMRAKERSKPGIQAIAAGSSKSEEKSNESSKVPRVKSVHLGMEDDSVIEIPMDSAQITSLQKTLKTNEKKAKTSKMKGSSTEQDTAKVPEDDNSEKSNQESDETQNIDDAEEEDPKDAEYEEKEQATISKPVTFEEFKKTLSPDELAFFTDEDGDEDELPLYDEGDENPEKKVVTATKTVTIVQDLDNDDDVEPKSKVSANPSKDENKSILKFISNIEDDNDPEKKVRVAKSSKEGSDEYDDSEDKKQTKSTEHNVKKPESAESKTTSHETAGEDDDEKDDVKDDVKTDDDDDFFVEYEDDSDDDKDEDDEDHPLPSNDSGTKKNAGMEKGESDEHGAVEESPSQENTSGEAKQPVSAENLKDDSMKNLKVDEESEDAADHTAPDDNEYDDEEEEEEEKEERNPDTDSSNEAKVKAEKSPFRTAEQEVETKGIAEAEFEKLSKPVSWYFFPL